MDSPGDRQIALRCYGQGNPFSALQVVDQAGLMMFYSLTTRKEDMLYVPSFDAIVVAGQEENLLRVYDVFCAPESGTLAQILRAAAQPGTRAAELMFTPVERGGMDVDVRWIYAAEDGVFVAAVTLGYPAYEARAPKRKDGRFEII